MLPTPPHSHGASEEIYFVLEGTVLLQLAGSPEVALTQLEGKIWEKSITKAEIDDYQSRFRVISSKLVAGKPIIHVLSDGDPGEGFRPTPAGLEDVFFSKIITAA